MGSQADPQWLVPGPIVDASREYRPSLRAREHFVRRIALRNTFIVVYKDQKNAKKFEADFGPGSQVAILWNGCAALKWRTAARMGGANADWCRRFTTAETRDPAAMFVQMLALQKDQRCGLCRRIKPSMWHCRHCAACCCTDCQNSAANLHAPPRKHVPVRGDIVPWACHRCSIETETVHE